MLLDIRYKFNKVDNMANLLDVIDKEFLALFFEDDVTRTIVIIWTTHNMKDVLTIWKGPNWKSFLIGLLNAKANFKVVAYIYNHESFNAKANFKVVVSIYNHESFKSLLTIVTKLIFTTKIWFEFGQHMA